MLNWLFQKSPTSRENPQRWIALDLETTGLDPHTDRIIEIGAVAMHQGEIALNDFFHRVLSGSGTVSAENRTIHGVTAKEQYDGAALNDALDALLNWINNAPIVGFYTAFDVQFLRTAIGAHAGKAAAKAFAAQPIDVSKIAPTLFPEKKAKSLSEWSAALDLPIRKQHRALADSLATAHLLQCVLSKLPAEKRSFAHLQSLESAQRWL